MLIAGLHVFCRNRTAASTQPRLSTKLLLLQTLTKPELKGHSLWWLETPPKWRAAVSIGRPRHACRRYTENSYLQCKRSPYCYDWHKARKGEHVYSGQHHLFNEFNGNDAEKPHFLSLSSVPHRGQMQVKLHRDLSARFQWLRSIAALHFISSSIGFAVEVSDVGSLDSKQPCV